MSFRSLTFALVMLAVGLNAAKILTDGEAKAGHVHKLSDQDHYTDVDNDNKMEHNPDYDHEAFLGKEEADKFKELTPEQSKEKLKKIIEKIDNDHDEFIVESELQEWLKNVTKKTIEREVDEKWKEFESRNTIDAYLKYYYGALDSWSDEEKQTKKDDYKVYLKLMERDKKKFKAADLDGDGKLNKNEFGDFLHPEESIHMRDIVINETLEDLDKNNDGVVSADEFISDLFRVKRSESDNEIIRVEKENFLLYRDKNGDKVMDREEIAAWILPNDYDHTLNEAKHLIHEADENKDGKLTKKEILENFNLFVSSRATAYGQAIYDKEDL